MQVFTARHVAWMVGGVVVGLLIASWPLAGAYAAVAAVVGTLIKRGRLEALACLLFGAAAPLLFVAWLHRRGPGVVTGTTDTGRWMEEYLDPKPWAIAGLITLGVALVFAAFSRWLNQRKPQNERQS